VPASVTSSATAVSSASTRSLSRSARRCGCSTAAEDRENDLVRSSKPSLLWGCRIRERVPHTLLAGNAAANTRNGGAGDDTYVVDNAADIVVEAAGEGVDRVSAAVTFTLAPHVENLTLTGAAAIDGSGNARNNSLVGNSASNVLTGHAGDDTLNDGATGADSIRGGSGNDTYRVDNAGDMVSELPGEGTDLVQSAVAFVLGPARRRSAAPATAWTGSTMPVASIASRSGSA
jgi:Ca2+-binding RTX toxin-like protein